MRPRLHRHSPDGSDVVAVQSNVLPQPPCFCTRVGNQIVHEIGGLLECQRVKPGGGRHPALAALVDSGYELDVDLLFGQSLPLLIEALADRITPNFQAEEKW